MEIKNLKTGNLIRFGGEHFKRLEKLQETTGVKYFTKKDLAGCVSANKKNITKPRQKVKKLGTNAKRKQKGGKVDRRAIIDAKIKKCEVFEAIRKNTLYKIKTYVKQGGDIHGILDIYEDEYGFATYSKPLTYACMKNQPEIVKYLVDTGADVNEAHSENGYTPLHYAVLNNSFDIVDILLLYDAAVNPKTHDGETPLDFASEKNSLEIVKYLVEKKADVTDKSLYYAVENNSLQLITYLVDKGGNINAKYKDGDTLLQHACQVKNNLEIVKYLVDIKKADVNSKNNYHETPLHHACSYGSLAIVNYLVEKGADVNALDDKGETLLHKVCFFNEHPLEIVKYLVEKKKADVNAQTDSKADTSLHYASGGLNANNNLELVKYLVDNKADVNSKNKDSDTPLHNSCRNNSFEIVNYLVDNKANLNAKDKDNKTPLEIASQEGHTEIVDFLMKKIQLKYNEFKKNIARGGGKLRKKQK